MSKPLYQETIINAIQAGVERLERAPNSYLTDSIKDRLDELLGFVTGTEYPDGHRSIARPRLEKFAERLQVISPHLAQKTREAARSLGEDSKVYAQSIERPLGLPNQEQRRTANLNL